MVLLLNNIKIILRNNTHYCKYKIKIYHLSFNVNLEIYLSKSSSFILGMSIMNLKSYRSNLINYPHLFHLIRILSSEPHPKKV